MNPPVDIGYCTNVHAGRDWDEMRENLQRHATAVRRALDPEARLGLGLWFSARSARELVGSRRLADLRAWLHEHGLFALTFNGFPCGDFHQQRVKHAVYTPSWAEPARLAYTLDLIEIAGAVLEEGRSLSISTVPLGWGDVDVTASAGQLLDIAERLEAHERRTGQLLHLDLEPEPGCILQTSGDVVAFFDQHLFAGTRAALARRYLRVCHDVCHQAVMFETPAACIAAYAGCGIAVGKVQISSGLCLPFDEWTHERRQAGLQQLRAFQEARYLHQTTVREADGPLRFFEDLPEALADLGDGPPAGEWRVHFHVPVFLERCGALETTRQAIPESLAALGAGSAERHHEVETYAWEVLPAALRGAGLADDIARELRWARELAGEVWGVSAMTRALRGYVELARLSNLPTVLTNTLVGSALAAGAGVLSWSRLGWAAFAVAALYASGMILNDVIDAAFDARVRPERPIPSGLVSRQAAAVVAVLLMVGALIMLAMQGRAAAIAGALLAGCILAYDLLHRQHGWTVWLMGGCRGLVYWVAAAVTAWPAASAPLVLVSAAVLLYTVVLTVVARSENEAVLDRRKWLALCVPVIVLLPIALIRPQHGLAAVAVGALLCAWLGLGTRRLLGQPPDVRGGVLAWLAGFCLIDAFILALLARWLPLGLAIACWLATIVGHRRVAGT